MLQDLRWHLGALLAVLALLAAVTVVDVPVVTVALFELGSLINFAGALVGFTKAALVGSFTASVCFATMFASLMYCWYWWTDQEVVKVELVPLTV